MIVLIKNVTIIHADSSYHLQKQDILIVDGRIEKIDSKITNSLATILEGTELYCCIGLCDIGTHSGEPGFEHRETIDSLTKSALAGGYTSLAVFPNNKPITQTKADIKYLKEHPDCNGVEIWPIGALSKNIEGKDIAEYMDMTSGGAVAFSDGMRSVQDTGLINRALQYVSQIEGTILHHPDDHHLSQGGEIHEGQMSTSLGLKGIPDIAELQMVQRDILANEYSGGYLIEHSISAERSVLAIRKAKTKLKTIFATVPYMNLLHTDNDLSDFDTNLKVKPVLRSKNDQKALIKGLSEGTIDAIVSNHTPLDIEMKNLEFPYAQSGAGGLETCLVACVSGLQKEISLTTIIHNLSISPRKILHLPIPTIEEGILANLCIFDAKATFKPEAAEMKSKSLNNPYLGTTFDAKVLSTIIGQAIYISG